MRHSGRAKLAATFQRKLKSLFKRATRFQRACQFFVYNHAVTHLPSYTLRRWYLNRTLGYEVEQTAAIHMGCFVTGDQVAVGAHSVVNRRCYLDGRGGLTIGKSVSISPECYILSATHDYNDPRFRSVMRHTVVNDSAWIGARAIVLPGIQLGRGAVLGAGSVATRDVPDGLVYAGNPARKIGERSQVLDYNLRYFPWFDTDIV